MMLRKLKATSFRNLVVDNVELAAGSNLVLGSNGQGKTNFLEAIAVLGNLRSFRSADPRKLARVESRSYRLEGMVRSRGESIRLTQMVETGPPVRRQLMINGAQASIESYLFQFPVFALSARDALLVTGSPDGRRAIIDRLAFFFNQGHIVDLRTYKKCLRQRNAAVMGGSPKLELSLWEDSLAQSAAKIVCRRVHAVQSWQSSFVECYDVLRPAGFPNIGMAYRGEQGFQDLEPTKVAEIYRQRYHDSRARDRQAGYTVDGPHRHDLQLRVGGRFARDVLSAGQVKTVAAALCFSTLRLVEKRRKELLPILVDDVDAEIDDEVLEKLIGFLGGRRQMFLSSAHEKNLVGIVSNATRMLMVNGTPQSLGRPSEDENE